MQKVSILPLGWLGLATHQHLAKAGYEVSGSYSSTPKGIESEYQFDLNSDMTHPYLKSADIVIINIPPSKITEGANFLKLLGSLLDKKLIFISSTSVYGMQGDVDETTIPEPETKNGLQLLKWENFIKENFKHYQIIRSAGQIGPNRHPGNILSGRKDVLGGEQPVNIISQTDLLYIIRLCIESDESRVINAANTHHPIKKDFYSSFCDARSIPRPEFKEEKIERYKRINTIYKDYEINSNLNQGI